MACCLIPRARHKKMRRLVVGQSISISFVCCCGLGCVGRRREQDERVGCRANDIYSFFISHCFNCVFFWEGLLEYLPRMDLLAEKSVCCSCLLLWSMPLRWSPPLPIALAAAARPRSQPESKLVWTWLLMNIQEVAV